jgi:hypothetical protein
MKLDFIYLKCISLKDNISCRCGAAPLKVASRTRNLCEPRCGHPCYRI